MEARRWAAAPGATAAIRSIAARSVRVTLTRARSAQFGRHRGRFGLNLFRIRAVADPVGGVQPASRAAIRRR